MKHSLDMLAENPGVRHVMLVTDDGVPIAISGSAGAPAADGGEIELPEDDAMRKLGTEDALAGLAIGLLTDLSIAVGQMSWKQPHRVVLRAARGTLILQTMQGAVLLVLLAHGLRPEELRLPMDGTIARIERSLRDMGGMGGEDDAMRSDAAERMMETPGLLPSTEGGEGTGTELEEATEQGERGSHQ